MKTSFRLWSKRIMNVDDHQTSHDLNFLITYLSEFNMKTSLSQDIKVKICTDVTYKLSAPFRNL